MRSIEGGEEVGVDEGEEDEAEAFDADNYVAVFVDADHVANVAFEFSTCDAYRLIFLEIRFIEDLTSGFVIGCE